MQDMHESAQRNKIKVLIVDDSFFMRKLLRELLEVDPDIEIVGEARDGAEAIGEVVRLSPDVVTMDYNMPRMNGADTVCHILNDTGRRPAVIMLSATTTQGAEETFACLRAGAVDYIVKPSGELSLDIETIAEEIIAKVKVASRAHIRKYEPLQVYVGKKNRRNESSQQIIAIGASTGGPPALEDIVSKLPGSLGAAVLITQHMPPNFTRSFAERLDRVSELVIHEAMEGEEVKNGMGYVAPGGYHMVLRQEKNGALVKNFIHLTLDPPVNNFRPSVDVMFRSVAQNGYMNKTIGVILTGMGEDGREGMRTLKDAGAHVFAQDPKTAAVASMPNAVINAGLADEVLPPEAIAQRILDLV